MPPVVDEAPEDEEETAPVREESPRETYMAPQAAAPVAAPAVQPAPAPVPAPVPVVTDEVVGAELTARVGDVTVTAQGTAQPFDGTVSVDSPIGRAEYALPAKEVAAAQQVGQAVAGTLPPEQKAVVDDVHNAAIEFVEGLPQHQVGAVGGLTYDATFEHAVEYH
ncbi:hypothetical protein NQ042_10605 [Corynebacterium phoceense]|uniref:hypothetical protein n=1 Tax=Corynebacterium phoceense TaxID=1686286 RepID=UPI00211CCF6E|nr:hypothetical protein [Corynebacterium phoceense]MCQ9334515.1 hypothetical protein [Corynebacterium phoceense]